MNDPDLREPEPVSRPAQLWQPWTLIVPTILLLPLLSLASAWQISPSSDADLRRTSYHRPRNLDTPESIPSPEPQTAPQATPVATLPPPVILQKLTYYVPDAQGQLRAKTFLTTGGNSNAGFVALGKAAFAALLPDAPEYFPAGTKLQSLALDELEPPLARVSLNEKFWNSDFWTGASRTDAAMQAIAHTLQATYQQTGGTGPLQIQLLRDDHEMEILGEYDVRVPYTPDASVVAGKSTQTAPVTKP